MKPRDDWPAALPAAAEGEEKAAERVARGLLEWTRRHLRDHSGPDQEEVLVDFVAHMVCDQLTHLAAVEPNRREAYLWQSWRHFLINWRAQQGRRRSHECSWPGGACNDEDGSAGMEEFPATAPDPEAIVLGREEMAGLFEEVTHLAPVKQSIFGLLVGDGLTEKEIASALGMDAGTVRWHVYTIRQRLTQWRRDWNAG